MARSEARKPFHPFPTPTSQDGHRGSSRNSHRRKRRCYRRQLIKFHSGEIGHGILCFAPAAPPRFDEFLERLAVSWTLPSDDQTAVEEVMRSCGGAVQGIRELSIDFPGGSDNEQVEGLYLNRANDGFVFLDNGSYSYGPVQRSDDSRFLANLMFGKTARVTLMSDLESDNDPSHELLRKTYGAPERSSLPSVTWEDDPCEAFAVDFSSGICCSMPSLGQPWMLQRAKWTKMAGSTEETTDNELELLPECSSLKCWVLEQSASAFASWSGVDGISSGEDQIIVQMGALAEDSGFCQLAARTYNSGSGALTNVIVLQGWLRKSKDGN